MSVASQPPVGAALLLAQLLQLRSKEPADLGELSRVALGIAFLVAVYVLWISWTVHFWNRD